MTIGPPCSVNWGSYTIRPACGADLPQSLAIPLRWVESGLTGCWPGLSGTTAARIRLGIRMGPRVSRGRMPISC